MQNILLKIAIRVDANNLIGGGHFRRCLSLAEELQKKGHKILIISASLPIKMQKMLEINDLSYKILEFSKNREKPSEIQIDHKKYPQWLSLPKRLDAKKTNKYLKKFEPDWIIFDNYGLDFHWVMEVKKNLSNVFFLAIDDLDNRNLGADFVLDQTSLYKRKRKYKSAGVLEGPTFTLLAKSFRELRNKSISERSKRLSNNYNFQKFSILISVGMYDPKKILPHLLKATAKIENVNIDVAVSSDSQTIKEVKRLTEKYPNINMYLDKFDIGSLMLKADLCIGASGMSTWERCCMGVPTLAIAIAQNQKSLTKKLAKLEAAKILTLTQAKNKQYLFNVVTELINSPNILRKLSRNSQNLCDGLGTKRVIAFLESTLRTVQITDSGKLLSWRNQLFVREMSLDKKTISKDEHYRWMRKTQNTSKGIWLIYSEGNVEIGHCNSVFETKNTVVWSFYIGENDFSKGAGRRMLTFFLKKLFNEKGIMTINAKVSKQNIKSKLIHKHFGFTCKNRNEKFLTYSLTKRKFEHQFFSLTETQR